MAAVINGKRKGERKRIYKDILNNYLIEYNVSKEPYIVCLWFRQQNGVISYKSSVA